MKNMRMRLGTMDVAGAPENCDCEICQYVREVTAFLHFGEIFSAGTVAAFSSCGNEKKKKRILLLDAMFFFFTTRKTR